jgi:hypothetical protein
MKRFVSFAAVLALLGGMAFLALPSDDAVAQSRVKIKTLMCWQPPRQTLWVLRFCVGATHLPGTRLT